MSYCPDCGSDELIVDINPFMVTCHHCNYSGNFIEYMDRSRSDRPMLNIYQSKKDCLTLFDVHYMAQRIALGEFSVRNSKLQIQIATTQSSSLPDLLKLLRTCFREDVFIRVNQHSIDSKIEACPLCLEKKFFVLNSNLVCANCSRFVVSIPDFVASLICKGGYICKDFAKKKNLADLDKITAEYLDRSLSQTFFVYTGDTQREKFEFRGYALASIEIRNPKGAEWTVVAVRPIKAEDDQIKDIISYLQNKGVTLLDSGTQALKVVQLRP